MTVTTGMVFGRVVALTRDLRGLTQLELAELAGITRANLAVIETGYHAPSFRVLLSLQAGGAAFTPSRLLRLVHLATTELQKRGYRVVNRPPSKGKDRRKPGDFTDIDAGVGFVIRRIERRPVGEIVLDGEMVDFDEEKEHG